MRSKLAEMALLLFVDRVEGILFGVPMNVASPGPTE